MKWRSWELPTPEQLWRRKKKKEGHFLSISMGPQLLFILSASPHPSRKPPNLLLLLLHPQKLFFFWSPLILRIYAELGTATDKRPPISKKIRWLLQSRICKCKCEQWSWLTARKVEMKESCRCECLCFCSLTETHPANYFFFFSASSFHSSRSNSVSSRTNFASESHWIL